MRVDGRLDEPAWQRTPPIGRFVQREPVEGGEPSEDTDVCVLYTKRVMIVLDPFFDHRNGFFFQVNPAGARADRQVSNNAERLSQDWDGIWNAVAPITDEGWVAEIEIPFKTLRFKPGQSTWGLNIERQIKRQEIDRWTAARQNIWISNLAEAGRLEGSKAFARDAASTFVRTHRWPPTTATASLPEASMCSRTSRRTSTRRSR